MPMPEDLGCRTMADFRENNEKALKEVNRAFARDCWDLSLQGDV